MTGAAVIVTPGAPGVLPGAVVSGSGTPAGAFSVSNDGTGINGGTGFNWALPAIASVAAYYQVKVDVTGGAFSSGDVTGSFLDCSTSRSWVKAIAGVVTFTITFREKATTVVRSTQAGLTLTVT